MKIDDSPESGLSRPADGQGVPADIDQMLESIGARYIADLRSLSEAFNQFYTSLLGTKDAQLAQLDQRAAAAEHERDEQRAMLTEKDIQIARLGERIRDRLQGRKDTARFRCHRHLLSGRVLSPVGRTRPGLNSASERRELRLTSGPGPAAWQASPRRNPQSSSRRADGSSFPP